MQFARIDDTTVTPAPDVQAFCPGCGQPVIAKCGTQRVHHWAHRTKKVCDSWWERETEWHRAWKNNFPRDWQEIFLPDELTGEKHMADVRTSHGLVLEFQHSHLQPQERTSREQFYKKMIWVVDGTRLKYDYPRFEKAMHRFKATTRKGVFLIEFPEQCFPKDWLGSTVPVAFDFRGMESVTHNDVRKFLFCLFPKPVENHAMLLVVPRTMFVESARSGELMQWVEQDKSNADDQATQPAQQPAAPIRRSEPQYILHRGRWRKRTRL